MSVTALIWSRTTLQGEIQQTIVINGIIRFFFPFPLRSLFPLILFFFFLLPFRWTCPIIFSFLPPPHTVHLPLWVLYLSFPSPQVGEEENGRNSISMEKYNVKKANTTSNGTDRHKKSFPFLFLIPPHPIFFFFVQPVQLFFLPSPFPFFSLTYLPRLRSLIPPSILPFFLPLFFVPYFPRFLWFPRTWRPEKRGIQYTWKIYLLLSNSGSPYSYWHLDGHLPISRLLTPYTPELGASIILRTLSWLSSGCSTFAPWGFQFYSEHQILRVRFYVWRTGHARNLTRVCAAGREVNHWVKAEW